MEEKRWTRDDVLVRASSRAYSGSEEFEPRGIASTMPDRLFDDPRDDAGAYIPTAAAIEAAAAEIRATWSDDDRRKRLCLPADDGVELIVARDNESVTDQ